MARKRTTKSASPAAAKPQALTVRPTVQVSEATPTYYVNSVEVSNTQHDFSLICTKIPAKLTPAEWQRASATGELAVEASVLLTCPTTLIPALVRALNTQKEMYEKQNGPIPDLATITPVGRQSEH